MITKRIEREEILFLLREFFAADPILVEKFHAKAGDGLETCVSYDLAQMTEPGTVSYVVEENGDAVALISFSRSALDDDRMINAFALSTGYDLPGGVCETLNFFMVKPEFRDKETMAMIWSFVRKANQFRPFLVGIRERNIPATRFYEKRANRWLTLLDDPKNPGQRINLFLMR